MTPEQPLPGPAGRAGGDPDDLLAALDPEQRRVATTLTGPVAVIAGAGTGKTRAITHRIAYGVRTGVYAPNSVLAVTFTTRAAGEMRGRLAELGVAGVQARTFHSAALRQLRHFWPKAYGSELPPIENNRMSLVAEAAGRAGVGRDTATLRDLAGEIGWAKVSNVSPVDYPEVARTEERLLASLDPEAISRVFAGYEAAKQSRGNVDFEDILLCTAAMLGDNPGIADEVRRTYRHLVVDEYQDVSPVQETLLRLWLGSSRNLCVVGDPAQTIHSFAGARADFLTGFAARHRGTEVIRLFRDYRSTHQVVEVANTIMEGAGKEKGASSTGLGGVTLQAQRTSRVSALLRYHDDERAEAAAVADWLAGRAELGVPLREMAILFRVNSQSPQLEQALNDRGIAYQLRSAERFYERGEVRQALGALRAQARLGASTPASEQVDEVMARVGWSPTPPHAGGQTRERWESVAALKTVADDLLADAPDLPFEQVVLEFERRAAVQQPPTANAVTLSTIHSAKGLEWDAVAVVGAQEGKIPFVLARTPAQIAEERRLLYVAVTRAREHLMITWAGSSMSRFLHEVRSDGTRETHQNSLRIDPFRGAPSDRRPTLGERRRPQSWTTTLASTCRSCRRRLDSAAEVKLGRHRDCPATYDEKTWAALQQWRDDRAAQEKLPPFAVFTDATLTAIAEARPTDVPGLLRIRGVGKVKVDRYGADLVRLLKEF